MSAMKGAVTMRDDGVPQLGQSDGAAYSLIDRHAVNGPQRSHE